MSHFTVLIIGENPEGQLEPFDEGLETEPIQQGEVSEEEKQHFIGYYKKKEGITDKTFEELYAIKGDEWNANRWVLDELDGKWYEYSTYNPDSKWDCYSLGGRWSGFFKMKAGIDPVTGRPGVFGNIPEEGYSDQAIKSDIDFEGMKNDAGEKARAYHKKVVELFGGVLPVLDHKWKDLIDGVENRDEIDAKRTLYHNQPAMVTVKNVCNLHRDELGFFFNLEDFEPDEEKHVQNAKDSAIATYAVLYNGEWIGKGEMGWWGISSGDMDQNEWNKKVSELVDSLPEDTLLSMYDCHI
jgi:hypothetical protein